jgi:hypothetical protein
MGRQAIAINSGRGAGTRSHAGRFTLHSREGELRWRVLAWANGVDRGAAGGSALRGDEQRHHGGRLPAPEAPPRDQARRNMATPQRNPPLWAFVAYGALALAMLAMSERPIIAKGRPDPHRATAMAREPPDSEGEIDRSRAAERGRGRQATSPSADSLARLEGHPLARLREDE